MKISYNLSLTKLFIFLAPFFVTMPIVTIPIGGSDISVFSVLFICLLALLAFRTLKQGRIKLKSPLSSYLIWLSLALFGTVCGVLYFGETYSLWRNQALSYLPKILLYLLFALCWGTVAEEEDTELALKGLYYGVLANVMFAVIDGVGYYLTGHSINNLLFSYYIERHEDSVTYGMLSLIDSGGSIRVSGFNTDSANIGQLAPIIVFYGIYNKKYLIALIGVASVVLAQTTTGLLCCAVIILFDIGVFIKKELKITPLTIIACAIIFCAVLYIVVGNSNRINKVADTAGSFVSRIENTYANLEYMMNHEPRFAHLIKIFPAVLNAGPLIFFGTGFGTMSYAYTMGNNNLITLPQYIGKAYDIDMTYLAYFFDVGIVGFVLYIYIITLIFRKFRPLIKQRVAKRPQSFIYYYIFSLIVTHFTYHYILSADQVLFIIIVLNYIAIQKSNWETDMLI